MAVMRKNLVLKFEAAGGKEVNLKVLKPMEGLSGGEIKTAMDTIVASGALGQEADVTGVVGAHYDIRELEEVTLA